MTHSAWVIMIFGKSAEMSMPWVAWASKEAANVRFLMRGPLGWLSFQPTKRQLLMEFAVSKKNIRQKKRPPKTPGEPLDGIVMI